MSVTNRSDLGTSVHGRLTRDRKGTLIYSFSAKMFGRFTQTTSMLRVERNMKQVSLCWFQFEAFSGHITIFKVL